MLSWHPYIQPKDGGPQYWGLDPIIWDSPGLCTISYSKKDPRTECKRKVTDSCIFGEEKDLQISTHPLDGCQQQHQIISRMWLIPSAAWCSSGLPWYLLCCFFSPLDTLTLIYISLLYSNFLLCIKKRSLKRSLQMPEPQKQWRNVVWHSSLGLFFSFDCIFFSSLEERGTFQYWSCRVFTFFSEVGY